MPSLKSPIAPSTPVGVGGDCLVFRHEERFAALRSSWINRLHLRLHTSNVPSNNRILSIEESRIPLSGSHNPKFSCKVPGYTGFPSRKPQISRGDGDGRLVSGFGPFQVRETTKSAGGGFDKGSFVGNGRFHLFRRGEQEGEEGGVGVLETKHYEPIGARISPLVHPFKPRLERISSEDTENGRAGLNLASSSRLQTCFGPWKVESRLKTPHRGIDYPVFIPALVTGSSRHQGATFHDLFEDAYVSRTFQSGHNLHDYVSRPRPVTQVLMNESEEPFSFWNMGRHNRANFVSSVSPSFDSFWNFNRKRKPIAGDIIPSSKYRRTGSED